MQALRTEANKTVFFTTTENTIGVTSVQPFADNSLMLRLCITYAKPKPWCEPKIGRPPPLVRKTKKFAKPSLPLSEKLRN